MVQGLPCRLLHAQWAENLCEEAEQFFHMIQLEIMLPAGTRLISGKHAVTLFTLHTVAIPQIDNALLLHLSYAR